MDLHAKEEKIVGMYITDTDNIYKTNGAITSFIKPEFNGYVPILSMFNLDCREKITFADGLNKDNEVVTYSRNTLNKKLDNSTIYNKKLDVTNNDLLLGPVQIVLNLTKYNVTMSDLDGYRKTYSPVENKNFEEFYGKILIFTLRTFNTPKYIHDITGYSNYLETYLEIIRNKTQDVYSDIRDVYQFLNDNWINIKFTDSNINTNSLKLISMVEVNESTLINSKDNTIYLSKSKVTISLENIIDLQEHPNIVSKLVDNTELRKIIKNNSFMCYIVDNNDSISDRFINIAGSVKKISKSKNPNAIDGLYLLITNDEGKPEVELLSKLEKIDEIEYIYKTIEEAVSGANIKQQYKDNIETERLELENLRITLSQNSIKEKEEYERKVRALNIAHEEEIKNIKINSEKNKVKKEKKANKIKNKSEKRKLKYENVSYRNKNDYEESKFKRDTTVETLKTIGAIAGIAATGYVIYNKISK